MVSSTLLCWRYHILPLSQRYCIYMMMLSNWNFSALLILCAGNWPVTDEFPSQRPVTGSFKMFSPIATWTIGWVNTRYAGDLRRHRAHYDVTVMYMKTHYWLLYMGIPPGDRWIPLAKVNNVKLMCFRISGRFVIEVDWWRYCDMHMVCSTLCVVLNRNLAIVWTL